MAFRILANEGRARVGEIATRHGVVHTPAFVPCATHGSLRGVPLSLLKRGSGAGISSEVATGDSSEVEEVLDLEIILANAYHLYLRPGIERIEALGGLHTFMNWEKAILTDSGGFQAFALPKFVKFQEEGIRFRSHLDGSEHLFTPELVIKIQERLGVDIATCLDVCTGFPVPEPEVAAAVDQTNRWAERSIRQWSNVNLPRRQAGGQMLLYGMIQGSIYPRLRERSATFLAELPFSGFAIGGNMYTFGNTIAQLAVEKPRMWEVVGLTTALLPPDKPRHLLGVGEPSDLVAGVAHGVDTFDCVMATRLARHGSVWVRTDGSSWQYRRLNLAAAAWATNDESVSQWCGCFTCQSGYSRAYLRHLLRERDPLGGLLLSLHNVTFLTELVDAIRGAIAKGRFREKFGPIQD